MKLANNFCIQCERERMGSNVVPLQRLVNLDQLDVNFWKINIYWAFNKQTEKKQKKKPNNKKKTQKNLYTKTHSLISEGFALEVLF